MKVNQRTPSISSIATAAFAIMPPSVAPVSSAPLISFSPSASPALIPFLGIVEAGFASPVDESSADIMHIQDYVIRDMNASFMVQVEDDSLMHMGICAHDMVIFERGADIVIGDVIVVLGAEGYRITTASPRVTDQIIGPVVSVIRKYK
jgi:SOS-response transcriptional repressor LexA